MGMMPMREYEACPHCGVTLQGEASAIGCVVRQIFEGVLFWLCPACGGRWHRWDRTSPLRGKAEPYVEQEISR